MAKEPVAPLATATPSALSAEMMGMLAQDAGAGLENVRAEDLAIPFVGVLQKNSPQVDPDKGAFIEGAKVGQFLETGTQTVYDEILVVPCEHKTAIVEWKPRETGGGFVKQHEIGYEKDFLRNERGQWVTDDGHLLIHTMYFFCLLLLPTGDTMPVILSFSSSQLKKARTWLTRLTSKKIVNPATGKKFTPPIYESIWKLTTVPEQNDKGSWRGVKIDVVGSVEDVELFRAAQKAKAMFAKTASAVTVPASEVAETEG